MVTGFTFAKRLSYNAQKWIGCKEEVENMSPCIAEIHRLMGNEPRPEPWCARLMWVVTDATCKDFKIANPLPKTASTKTMIEGAKQNGIRVDKKPANGSIFYYSTGEWSGHVGLLHYIKGSNMITIEGNKSNEATWAERPLDSRDFSFIHVEELAGTETMSSIFSAKNIFWGATGLIGAYLTWDQFIKKEIKA